MYGYCDYVGTYICIHICVRKAGECLRVIEGMYVISCMCLSVRFCVYMCVYVFISYCICACIWAYRLFESVHAWVFIYFCMCTCILHMWFSVGRCTLIMPLSILVQMYLFASVRGFFLNSVLHWVLINVSQMFQNFTLQKFLVSERKFHTKTRISLRGIMKKANLKKANLAVEN